MSYREALEAAGAEVHEFEQFGSYQGDWWAKVTFNQKTGWVYGSYGSCSGCDAFEGEFGYDSHQCGDKYKYSVVYDGDFSDECEICKSLKVRLVEFGKEYLDNILCQEEAEVKASENIEWDMDAHEMVEFIRSHRV